MRFFLFLLLALLPISGVLAAEQPSHLFILSGQSNMTGTLRDSFRSCVEQTLGKDKIIVVHAGHPGQPIKSWYKAWQPPEGMTDSKPETKGKLYDRLMTAVQRATKGKPIATTTFVWMQGESDAVNGWGSVYEKSFLGLLGQVKKDLGIEDIRFVVGRINEKWLDKPDGKLIRDVLKGLGENHPNADWVDTDDLNRGVNPWGGYSFEDGHYPPAGYKVMGQRFARKACRLIDPAIELDPAVFKEVFFDSADQIRSHAAAGKAVTASVVPEGRDLSALADGAFGELDHEDAAWVGFAPSRQPIELVIDLGEVVAIDSVAVHTMLSSKAKARFPKQLVYSVSQDGETYKINNNRYNTIKFADGKRLRQMRADGIEPTPLLLLAQQYGAKARYIKIEIQTADQWVLIDEVVVNPSAEPPAN